MEVSSLNEIDIANVGLALLDLDNTLYSYKHSHTIAMKAVADLLERQSGIELADFEVRYMTARKKVHLMHKHTAAGHSRFLYFQFFFENLLGYTDFINTTLCNDLYWDTFIDNMVLFPDALSFLQNCKTNNIPVCLVTDMLAEVQFKKVRHLKIEPYINYIVSSEEAGIEKPEPFIFNYAIEKSGGISGQSKNVIVVGDNPKADLFVTKDHSVTNYLILRNE